jgi:hypothetical protein
MGVIFAVRKLEQAHQAVWLTQKNYYPSNADTCWCFFLSSNLQSPMTSRQILSAPIFYRACNFSVSTQIIHIYKTPKPLGACDFIYESGGLCINYKVAEKRAELITHRITFTDCTTCRAPKAAGILAKSRTPAAKAPAHVFSGDKSAVSLAGRQSEAGAVPANSMNGRFLFLFYCERHPPEKENSRDPFTAAHLGDRPGCSPVTRSFVLTWVASRFASSLVSQSIVARSVNGAQLTQGAIHDGRFHFASHCLCQLHFDDCACTICSGVCCDQKVHYATEGRVIIDQLSLEICSLPVCWMMNQKYCGVARAKQWQLIVRLMLIRGIALLALKGN